MFDCVIDILVENHEQLLRSDKLRNVVLCRSFSAGYDLTLSLSDGRYSVEWMVLAVMVSWDNVTSEVDEVITAVRGNMVVIPCDVSWFSRPPATLQFQRHPRPLTTTTTTTTSRPLYFFSSIAIG